MFRSSNKGWESYNHAEGWMPCNRAMIVDAGDNILEDLPAKNHARLADKYRKEIQQGIVVLVGLAIKT